MPAKSPPISEVVAARLVELGGIIRTRRKALAVSATATAEAAGMSRVTLYRIEKGEASVTFGAYLSALSALGLEFQIVEPFEASRSEIEESGWIPARVCLSNYPQLKRLAWQVHGTDELTPREALDIYERNWRHLDMEAMTVGEQQLVNALRVGLGGGREDV